MANSQKLKSGEMLKYVLPGIGEMFISAAIDDAGGGGRYIKVVTHAPEEVTIVRNPKNEIDARRWPCGAPVNMQKLRKDGKARRDAANAERDAKVKDENERRQALVSGTLGDYRDKKKQDEQLDLNPDPDQNTPDTKPETDDDSKKNETGGSGDDTKKNETGNKGAGGSK